MKIKRYIQLTEQYEGLIADIGRSVSVDDKGTLFIVADLSRINNEIDEKIVPCKLIHLLDDQVDINLIELNNFVFKRYDFSER